MKKILTLVMLFVAIGSYTLHAQGTTEIGLIGGLNYSNVSGDGIEDNSSKLGFAIGGFLTFKLSEQFALRPEIYYTNKGTDLEFKESDSGTDYEYSIEAEGTISLNYIEIPILGVFSLNQNINIFAGPYLDYYLSGTTEVESKETLRQYTGSEWVTETREESNSEDIESDDINSLGYGLTFGGEYLFGQFSIGARYSLGLSNIPDDADDELKHSNIQLLVGFYF